VSVESGKKRNWQEREFDEIWDSLKPEIQSDLERLDHRLRTIWYEARICGVPTEMVQRKLRERFWGLVKEMTAG